MNNNSERKKTEATKTKKQQQLQNSEKSLQLAAINFLRGGKKWRIVWRARCFGAVQRSVYSGGSQLHRDMWKYFKYFKYFGACHLAFFTDFFFCRLFFPIQFQKHFSCYFAFLLLQSFRYPFEWRYRFVFIDLLWLSEID